MVMWVKERNFNLGNEDAQNDCAAEMFDSVSTVLPMDVKVSCSNADGVGLQRNG